MSLWGGAETMHAALCINVNATRNASSSSLHSSAVLRLTCPQLLSYHSLTDGHAVTTRRPDNLALPGRREARWWGDGCGLQGGGRKAAPLCRLEVPAGSDC